MKPLLVLCLGNDILSDDAFGSVVAKRLDGNGLNASIEVMFAPTAGFGLLDLLKGRKAVLVVDTIITGKADPGTVHFFPAGILTPSNNLINSHQINLPTALELGKQLGMAMPSDIQVVAVEAQDVETIGEQMTPPIEKAVETVLTAVKSWADSKTRKDVTKMTPEDKAKNASNSPGGAQACPDCQGRGWIDNRCATPVASDLCTVCNGKGFDAGGKDCYACHGTGRIEVRQVDKTVCSKCCGAGVYPVPPSMTEDKFAYRPGKR